MIEMSFEIEAKALDGLAVDLLIDELLKVRNRCPAHMYFRCGGSPSAPKRSCIRCWLDYAWYLANGKDDSLVPRDRCKDPTLKGPGE